MEHREVIADCGLRIAKLGTHPKGGSPQDNLKARSQESESRIQEKNNKKEFLLPAGYWLPAP